ncbi:MAG: polysaccharide biosynthesis tyrosine autokinase, partial [Alphaproteobacteria bacterium]|nr:polysaccharide biosynthesis tyrosine autokinase [Alphaproteobacteria bacterium]
MMITEQPGSVAEKVRAEARGRGKLPQGLSEITPFHQRVIDQIDLRHTGRTLWRWRMLIATVAIISGIIGVAVVQSLRPVYTATTQIAIGDQQPSLIKLEQIVSDLKGDNETIATEVGIIRSRKIAQKTVLKLGLDTMPEFNPPPSLMQRAANYLRTQRMVPLPWLDKISTEPEADDVGVDRNLNFVIDAVLDRLKVSNDGKSRIITISFQSSSPQLAAQVVNAIADFYVTSKLDAKLEATKRANLWLSDQLASLRQDVLTSDDAVEKFRRDHGLVRGQTSTIVDQQMSQVATEAMAAHTKLLEAQSRLIQVQRSDVARGQVGGDISSLPEVLQSPLIQKLREQESEASRRLADLLSHYGEKHPAVINARAELNDFKHRIQSEVAKVADALRNEVANQQARESSLNALMDKVKAQESRSNIDQVQLHELERNAQANKTLYENLLEKFKETQSEQSYQQSNAEIISPAVTPNDPSFPQKAVLIILSVIAGLVLGSLLALLRENMDVGLRSMEQVKELLHLNPLGMVPAIAGGLKRQRPEREVLDRPMSAYSEAMRTIHANLVLSDIDMRPKTVLVTSSLPSEGKSTVAVSLAYVMAREGLRVLVIDCDLRRPTVHKLSGAPSAPGLVDWLLDKAEFNQIVHTHQESGVDIITAGRIPSVPPNLLSSQRFQQMLKQVRQHYDFVLLDSAP